MPKLISIIPSTDGHFIAQQQEQSFAWVSGLLVVGAIIVAVIAMRTRSWVLWLAPCILLLVAVGLFFLNQGLTYKMDISPRDAMHYEQVKQGKVVAESNVYLENIASADMEYQRQNSRIVAVMRDGTKLYPMGEDWVSDEPQQFAVLNAIREAIGQIPAPGSERN